MVSIPNTENSCCALAVFNAMCFTLGSEFILGLRNAGRPFVSAMQGILRVHGDPNAKSAANDDFATFRRILNHEHDRMIVLFPNMAEPVAEHIPGEKMLEFDSVYRVAIGVFREEVHGDGMRRGYHGFLLDCGCGACRASTVLGLYGACCVVEANS